MRRMGLSFLMLLLLILSGYFGMLAYWEQEPILKANAQKEAIHQLVILNEETENTKEDEKKHEKYDSEKNGSEKENNEKENNETGSQVAAESTESYNRVIDFDILKKINRDIVGWIYIPDTSVDYPIVIGETDDAYLCRDFEGNESKLGAIFSYADTDKALSDARTVLFGHNMSQYVMFGELKRYVQEDVFRTKHQKMYIYTEKNTMEVELFSIFECSSKDSIFYDNTEIGSLEYQELLEELSMRNQYLDLNKKDVAEYYNSQSFTLVTCRGRAGTEKRLVINGIVSKQKYILS